MRAHNENTREPNHTVLELWLKAAAFAAVEGILVRGCVVAHGSDTPEHDHAMVHHRSGVLLPRRWAQPSRRRQGTRSVAPVAAPHPAALPGTYELPHVHERAVLPRLVRLPTQEEARVYSEASRASAKPKGIRDGS